MERNIRVYITESCNAKCSNCFNRLNRTNSSMDVENFEKICSYFKANGTANIKIMGGEPTVHPDFAQMTAIAQKYFKSVSVFTNAINEKIFEFSPREEDSIIYNFKFAQKLTKGKLLLDKPGRRSLEIQITTKTNTDTLVERLSSLAEMVDAQLLNPCLTLDCTENIFKYRTILVEKYEYVWEYCKRLGFIMGQDHLIPFCFISGTKIPLPIGGAVCQIGCAGLIDSSYNVKFCNQFPDHSIPLFNDGEIIPYNMYEEFLKDYYDKLVGISASKGCRTCSMFGILCNGGCFAPKETICYKDLDNYKIP